MKLHLGDLYWDETRKNTDYLELKEDFDIDVLVIGGGMSGALISHELGLRGFETAVIDKKIPGYGSSDGNTGIIQYHSDDSLPEMIENFGEKQAVDFYRLSIEAMKRLGEIAESLPEDTGYKKTHSLLLAAKEENTSALRENNKILNHYGFPSEYIDQETLEKDYNIHAYGALKTGSDAELNPFKMVQALHKENLKRGVKVYKNAPADKITEKENGFVITSGSFTINAKKLILAMGYAKDVYPNIEEALERNTTYSFVTEKIHEKLWGKEEMIWDDEDPYVYFRKLEDHRVIAGGRDEEGEKLSSVENIEKETNKIYETICSYYPNFKAKIAYRWQSVFGESKDGLPFIGRDEENKNKYYAFGYGGNGTCYSVMASMIIADFLEEKEHPLAYTTKYPREKN